MSWRWQYLSYLSLYLVYWYDTGGVRIGAPALTSRTFKEADFEKVADFLDRALQLCLSIQVG